MSIGYQTPPRQQALSTELRNLINERNILTTRTRMKGNCLNLFYSNHYPCKKSSFTNFSFGTSTVLSALEDMGRVNQEEKQKELRSQAIEEILTSEASYLHQLEVLMKVNIRLFFMKCHYLSNLIHL